MTARAPLASATAAILAVLLDYGYRDLRADHLTIADDGDDGHYWTISGSYFDEIYGDGEGVRAEDDAPSGYVHADGSIEGPYGGNPPPDAGEVPLDATAWDRTRLLAAGCVDRDGGRWRCRCAWCRVAIKEIVRRAVERGERGERGELEAGSAS